jgi:demethylmenaquinone methyltransferase/2-methoxy-6-polyprenyl-1,4-benzoquinol methylase
MEAYIKQLALSLILREPVIRSAIRTLQFMPDSHGLDIGSGIGNITALLAEAIAPGGSVTGVDISPDMVAYARDAAEQAGLTR